MPVMAAISPPFASRSACGNDLAGSRLGGVNLLGGVALGCRCILLTNERLLFQGHLGVSSIDLTALRHTLVQANGQTYRGSWERIKTFENLRNNRQTLFGSSNGVFR
jgi:hypothetical protein